MTPLQRRSKHGGRNQPRWSSFLGNQGLLSIIAITMLSAPFVPAPAASVRWHGAQTLAVEVGAVISLALLSNQLSSARTLPKNTTAPFVFLYASVIWDLVSWVRAGENSSATQGLLLLASGAVVTIVIVYRKQSEQNLLFLTDVLIIAGFLVAVSGITLYGINGTPLVVGVLHDHMLFGAFIMLLIPISFAISIAPVIPIRRLFAQASLITCVAAILMAQTRSSWIGCVAASLTFAVLLIIVRSTAPRKQYQPNKWRQLAQGGMIPALATSSFICFVCLSPDRAILYARVHTLTTTVVRGKDASTEWRFTAWTGAKAMIKQKPITGWGIGSYPRYQYPFTHMGQSG